MTVGYGFIEKGGVGWKYEKLETGKNIRIGCLAAKRGSLKSCLREVWWWESKAGTGDAGQSSGNTPSTEGAARSRGRDSCWSSLPSSGHAPLAWRSEALALKATCAGMILNPISWALSGMSSLHQIPLQDVQGSTWADAYLRRIQSLPTSLPHSVGGFTTATVPPSPSFTMHVLTLHK